jgi:hypothetical protein
LFHSKGTYISDIYIPFDGYNRTHSGAPQ